MRGKRKFLELRWDHYWLLMEGCMWWIMIEDRVMISPLYQLRIR